MPFNVNKLPPGGWIYDEPAIGWRVPNPMLPFNLVVEQIQKVRANNPRASLGTSWEVCESALKRATILRVATILPQNVSWTEDDTEQQTAIKAAKKRRCASCRK